MMDYFTKNKIMFWCILLLIVVNCVTITSFWLTKSPAGPARQPQQLQDGGQLIRERLQLTDEQFARFQQIRDEHFRHVRPIHADMHKTRMDLLNEVFAAEPDQETIDALLLDLGNLQIEFEDSLFTHFEQLKKICNPQQQEELKRMFIKLIEETRPRGQGNQPQQPGRTPDPAGGPGPMDNRPPHRQ